MLTISIIEVQLNLLRAYKKRCMSVKYFVDDGDNIHKYQIIMA